MEYLFSPGCALLIYKPSLLQKTVDFLSEQTQSEVALFTQCCKRPVDAPKDRCVVNASLSCARRYRENSDLSTEMLWEFFDRASDFPFPDYQGQEMTLLDPCPSRATPAIHDTVRSLLKKMNITLIEAAHNREQSHCCGSSLYGKQPLDRVKSAMHECAQSMPCDNVVVYCVSCVKALQFSGKKPRYILDLLFKEPSGDALFDPQQWQDALARCAEEH